MSIKTTPSSNSRKVTNIDAMSFTYMSIRDIGLWIFDISSCIFQWWPNKALLKPHDSLWCTSTAA
jgi:hypothetical protein